MPLTQRPATPEDLPWIISMELDPAFSPYITSWSLEQHERSLADPCFRYRVVVAPPASRVGFAILIMGNPTPGQVYLQRLAILHPGQGLGRRFLELLCQELFADTATERLWLHVFPNNQRGQALYQSMGFHLVAGATDPHHPNKRYRDALVMELCVPVRPTSA